MYEKYGKKQTYQFCEIRNTMVQLEVIQSTATMPDLVHAEARLVPVACNRSKQCRDDGVRCMVFDPDGADPCPGVWNG